MKPLLAIGQNGIGHHFIEGLVKRVISVNPFDLFYRRVRKDKIGRQDAPLQNIWQLFQAFAQQSGQCPHTRVFTEFFSLRLLPLHRSRPLRSAMRTTPSSNSRYLF